MRITTNYPDHLTVKNIVLDGNKLTFDLEIHHLRLNDVIRLTMTGKEEITYSGPGKYVMAKVRDDNTKLTKLLHEKFICYNIEED